MIKYICSVDRGTVISYDKEVENVSLLNHFYVDYIWYIPEDGEWIYTKKDGSKERRSVTKGTMVIKLYSIDKGSDAEYIFIENDEVKNHYNRLLEKRQEENKKYEEYKKVEHTGGDREVLADNTELSNKTRLCESECTDGTC